MPKRPFRGSLESASRPTLVHFDSQRYSIRIDDWQGVLQSQANRVVIESLCARRYILIVKNFHPLFCRRITQW